jgi:hypothetical protein
MRGLEQSFSNISSLWVDCPKPYFTQGSLVECSGVSDATGACFRYSDHHWGLRLLIKSAFMKSQRGQKAQKANMPSNFSLTSSYTRILIVMDQNPLQPIEIKDGW